MVRIGLEHRIPMRHHWALPAFVVPTLFDDEDVAKVNSDLEHSITDGRRDAGGNPRVISRRLQFVEVGREGGLVNAGFAPYLDYTPLAEEQKAAAQMLLQEGWLGEDTVTVTKNEILTALNKPDDYILALVFVGA